ncbi:unnamed protein product [Dovyalis caffra]|uniref:Uncharacterized protein n=1 Tax=Dovyalis caffra TaxID=77055 RepID=A0AAV1S9P4_9ROSI|nr:unnamed protein product [Dovyalis caffra]
MASSNNFDFPPTPPHVRPPPPHIRPPPPAPSPSDSTTVIVIVFVSFGGLIFLAFLATALWCFIKKKKKKTPEETDIVHVGEHLKVKEVVVEYPHGPKAVLLEIVDDVHVDEEIKKKEKEKVGESLRVEAIEGNASAVDQAAASSFPGSNNHPQLEHKSPPPETSSKIVSSGPKCCPPAR